MGADEDDDHAIAVLQAFVRRRRARQAFGAAVADAKRAFLDDAAVQAGATRGKFYSTAAMVMRLRIRNDPLVVAALDLAWGFVRAAAHAENSNQQRRGMTWRGLPLTDAGLTAGLGPAAYRCMIRKLYLVIKEMSGDTSISPEECQKGHMGANGRTEREPRNRKS